MKNRPRQPLGKPTGAGLETDARPVCAAPDERSNKDMVLAAGGVANAARR